MDRPIRVVQSLVVSILRKEGSTRLPSRLFPVLGLTHTQRAKHAGSSLTRYHHIAPVQNLCSLNRLLSKAKGAASFQYQKSKLKTTLQWFFICSEDAHGSHILIFHRHNPHAHKTFNIFFDRQKLNLAYGHIVGMPFLSGKESQTTKKTTC